jgi:hypothetical protein
VGHTVFLVLGEKVDDISDLWRRFGGEALLSQLLQTLRENQYEAAKEGMKGSILQANWQVFPWARLAPAAVVAAGRAMGHWEGQSRRSWRRPSFLANKAEFTLSAFPLQISIGE